MMLPETSRQCCGEAFQTERGKGPENVEPKGHVAEIAVGKP